MNREIATGAATIYPLAGDVRSQAGNQNVEVVGIISIPISQDTPSGGDVLEYDANSNQWILRLRASIQVNGATVSDDYIVSVNVVKEILVNGS